MEKIHLVTCKNLKSWSKTKKNILLGGWCYDYKERHNYKNYKFEIIDSPSLPFCERKNIDLAIEIQKIIENELKILLELLNKLHKVNFSEKYWNIILSPWLSNFVATLKIIEARLKIITEKYEIDSVTFYENKDEFFLPKDYSEGCKYLGFDGNYFNKIIQEIFNANHKNVRTDFIKCENQFNLNNPDLSDKEQQSFKRLVKENLFKVLNFFPLIEGKPFIIGTVFNSIWEIFFKINNFQIPKQIYYSKSFHFRERTKNREQTANMLIVSEIKDNKKKFLTNLILNFLPCSYIENFKKNIEIKNKKKWPQRPSYIFTCYSLYYDEIFKIYAAECFEKNICYIVGQHGNNFATRILYWKFPETYTATKFLVWGNKHDFANSYESFNLRTPRIINIKKKIKKKGILIICKTSYEETNLLESKYDYQNQNSAFLNKLIQNLSPDKKNNLIVRFLNDKTEEYCNEEQRLKDFDPKIKIEKGQTPIFKLIYSNKLTIFDYDSTGFLECLSYNIPALMYIDEKDLADFSPKNP